jgi:hypothetical protein
MSLSDEELIEKYSSDKKSKFGGVPLDSNKTDEFGGVLLDPNKEYIFGDSQVLYEDEAKKEFNLMEYLPLIIVVVFFVGGFYLLRKFASSARNFATPLKWLILVAWNMTLAVGIYESQRGTHLSPAMIWTSISIVLTYGYLFGFKKK